MNKTTSCLKLLLLAVCLQLAAAATVFAGAPLKINFQGRLDENGQPAEGSKTFVFKIYDAVSGGSPVWTSAAQPLALSNGVFSALLEAGTPAALSTATFAGARFVELTVDGVALAPRQAMVAAPYALVAQALAADADIPATAIADGSVTDAKVLLTTAAITSGRFSDDRVLITTGAFAALNGADQLVKLAGTGALPALDASALTALNPANLGAAVGAAKGGTGLTAAGASGNLLRSDGAGWTSWAPDYLSSYTETDPVFLAQKGAALGVATLDAGQLVPVAQIPGLDASKVTTGKFNDHLLALSTGAFPGGFNGAGQLVKLAGTGALPALDASALTALNPANLGAAVGAAKGGTGLTAAGASGNLLRSDGAGWTSWAPDYLSAYSETDPVFLAQKGAALGVATLDAGQLVPVAQIPGLDASKVTTGKFNDHLLALSTGAFPGGFNGAGQLPKLDASGRLGLSTGTVNSPLTLGGSVSLPIKTVTADYTIGAGDYTVLVDPVPLSVTISLPAVAGAAGRVYVIKVLANKDSVFLDTAGALLDGTAGTYLFGADMESLIIQSDGTAWYRLGGTGMLSIAPGP